MVWKTNCENCKNGPPQGEDIQKYYTFVNVMKYWACMVKMSTIQVRHSVHRKKSPSIFVSNLQNLCGFHIVFDKGNGKALKP